VLQVHTGEKPYKCNYCERRFKQQSHVKQHSRLHTGERPYKCIECGRTFVQLSNLQQHMGNHAKDPQKTKQFQSQNCQICGKGFATEASLNLHMEKKHRDILPPDESIVSMVRQPKPKAYVCVLCSKSYTTESALAIHAVKVHNVTFLCKLFLMYFAYSTNLRHLPRVKVQVNRHHRLRPEDLVVVFVRKHL